MRILIEAEEWSVGVEDGIITEPIGAFDVTFAISRGHLYAGLINAHEHLHRNHYGRLGTPPYPNAYAWGDDIHIRDRDRIDAGRRVPQRAALLRGAWKNLLSGVTTVVHHDRWEPDLERDFPLRVIRLRAAQSIRHVTEAMRVDPDDPPFTIHLAEGVDPAAAEEVRELDRSGLLNADTLAVHLVGVDADGIRRLRGSGAAVVWCPSSNHFLFGRTVPAGLLAPGVDVLLGSDSLLTGAGTLLDEIRFAHQLGLVSDDRLRDAVGEVAARRLRIPRPSLDIGNTADLVVLRRDLLEATVEDVALVIAGGVLRVLEPALARSLGREAASGSIVRFGGIERWIDQRSSVPLISRQARSR